MRLMKRFLVGLVSVAVLLAFSGDVLAVSKKSKKDTTNVVKQQKAEVKKPDAKKPEPKPPAKPPAPKPTKPPKKYDDFIDKNNNGIDDRKEKLVPKAAKEDKSKKTEKKK